MITLWHFLAVAAALFGIGLIGFLTRRNLITMFLCAEMMLQGVTLNLVAFGDLHRNYQGQSFIIFILTVAACEAALALAIFLVLYRSHRYQEAVRSYDKALMVRSELVVAHRWRGEAFLKLNQAEDAMRAFNDYIVQGGKPEADVYCGRAQAKVKLNNHRAALDDYSKALTLSNTNAARRLAASWAGGSTNAPRANFKLDMMVSSVVASPAGIVVPGPCRPIQGLCCLN